jgi:hypothetical protein
MKRPALGNAGKFQEFDGFRVAEGLHGQAAEESAPARRAQPRGQWRFTPAQNHVHILRKSRYEVLPQPCIEKAQHFIVIKDDYDALGHLAQLLIRLPGRRKILPHD